MALTLEFMRDLVLDRLDDDDFETEYLDQALNEAQWEITNRYKLRFLEKSDNLTLAADASSVAYPSDYRELIGLAVTDGASQSYDITNNYLDYATFKNHQITNPTPQASQPIYWTTYGGNILFLTPADVEYTLSIDYIRTAPRVDGSTVLEFLIPDEYQELLKLGAFMRIAKREDDYDVKDQEKVDYSIYLADLVRAYSRNAGPRRKRVMRTQIVGNGTGAGVHGISF